MGPRVLFLTTHRLNSGHKNWNLELIDALDARSITWSCHALIDDRGAITAQSIAHDYTHVCFLLLGDYPTHHNSVSKFLQTTLDQAVKLNPQLRILNSPRITAWNSDKQYLDELYRAGFPVPTTAFLNKRQPIDYLKMALYTQCHGNPVVIKPSISASGARTHRVKDPQSLTAEDDAFLNGIINIALKSGQRGSIDVNGRKKSVVAANGVEDGSAQQDGLLSIDEEPEDNTFGSFMMQEYITEVEKGEYSLCYAGGRYLYTVLKRPKDGGWQVGSEFGGSYAPVAEEEVPADAKRTAQELIQWIEDHFEGDKVEYARVDGVMRKDGTFTLMEIELIEPSLFLFLPEVGKMALEALCDTIQEPLQENIRPTSSAPA